MNLRTLATLSVCVLSLSACDKLRGGGGTDGGASSSTTSGGGITGLASKALSLVSPSGEAFEGAITMNDTHAGKAADVIVYEVKGDKLRFDDPARHAYVIFNAAEKKMITVDDAKKTAMVIDLDQMQKLAGTGPGGPHAPAAAGPSDEDVSIDMSGGTDVVAGYACDKWKITETNKKTAKVRKTDACLAKGIGFPDMSMGQGGATKSWMSKLVTDKFFPLRAVTTEDGVEQSRMEVTKIEKKTLDAARFEVPAGYTVTDMAQLMKGLGGMHPPQAPH